MERERNDDGDDREDVEVLLERGLAFRCGNQSGFEPEEVGERRTPPCPTGHR